MAWRNPQYNFVHAVRTAGAASITPTPAAAAGFPVDNLIDDRAGSLFKFTSSGAGSTLVIDRGAGSLDAIDRLLIPAGHNITGTIDLEADDNAGFTSPTALLTNEAVATGLIDETFASNTERYLKITFDATGTWEITQLIFTEKRTTTRGPNPLPGWPDQLIDNTLLFPKASGVVAALELGADRRRIQYDYRVLESADELVFSDLWTECATARPFFLDPAYDDETPIWVRLVEPIERRLDTVAPQSDSRKYFRRLIMLEHLA